MVTIVQILHTLLVELTVEPKVEQMTSDGQLEEVTETRHTGSLPQNATRKLTRHHRGN